MATREHSNDATASDWQATRIAAGLTVEALAARLGVHSNSVRRFERHDPGQGERFRNKLALAYRALAAEVAAINGVSGSTST